MELLYADVMVPVRVQGYFTYHVPSEMVEKIAVGMRVIVEFGEKKIYTAIVVKLHNQKPTYPTKFILSVWDEQPIIYPAQIQFWEWIADYYLCAIGEVMNQAIPSGLKLSTQSRIQLNKEHDISFFIPENFTPNEWKIVEELIQKESLSYDEVANILEVKNIAGTLRKLVKKRAIILFDNIKDSYSPKRITYIKLAESFANPDGLEKLFAEFSKQEAKQEAVILRYLSLVPLLSYPEKNIVGIPKSELLSDKVQQKISASAFQTLLKKGIFQCYEKVVSRLDEMNQETEPLFFELTSVQQTALKEIINCFQEKNVCLLHGVTGSGKTEIYLELIRQNLENGNQVLFLVPEIALTTQLVGRMRRYLGKKIGVYHHKYSDAERTEVWRGVLDGTYEVVIGVRSSIFLPFHRLGLIVVDEEHETSYKQSDTNPRYQARDLAIVLGSQQNAKVLLGSATPSVESYYQAQHQKFGLVKLPVRYGDAQLPEFVIIDTIRERKMKQMKDDYASVMLDALQKTVENGNQAIIFKNRRGYAPQIVCQDCDWTPSCPHCSVNLTYHLIKHELRCHYCSYTQAVPSHCLQCSSPYIRPVGIGTQKAEDDLKQFLPHARIQRMDLDSTRSKNAHQTIIEQFENRQVDILVGTQMITKGLDFAHVRTVGVIGADALLHFPDFRANERAFQLLTQVSGRAGRRSDLTGIVYIQTTQPHHPVLLDVVNQDYENFYRREISERYQYCYPPFVRLTKISIKSENAQLRDRAATYLAQHLRNHIGNERILGPENPYPEKIRNLYYKVILIKLERGIAEFHQYKKNILTDVQDTQTQKEFRKVFLNIDVDTYL